MASEATALTAVEAAAAAPEASAPTKIDDVSLDALDAARGCAYAVFFSLSVAWGIWAEVYTFFLEGVGGYGPDHAAAISSYSLLVYAGGQCVMMPVLGALSDRCGRRALLLGAFTLDAAFMASYALASEAWWITASALMGLLDGAWVACHAVVADNLIAECARLPAREQVTLHRGVHRTPVLQRHHTSPPPSRRARLPRPAPPGQICKQASILTSGRCHRHN